MITYVWWRSDHLILCGAFVCFKWCPRNVVVVVVVVVAAVVVFFCAAAVGFVVLVFKAQCTK